MRFKVNALMAGLFLFLLSEVVFAAEKADIVVGAGEAFTTVQAAINSVPSNNSKNVTILVKNGIYKEQIVIDKSFISIIGESRENTIIQFSLEREQWAKAHESSYVGCAVIVIGAQASAPSVKTTSQVTDIVIGNLTVENTYDTTGSKTMVIKDEGNSNRIWVVNCNVWCKGHDTISLWSKKSRNVLPCRLFL
jgi:pectinesterase